MFIRVSDGSSINSNLIERISIVTENSLYNIIFEFMSGEYKIYRSFKTKDDANIEYNALINRLNN